MNNFKELKNNNNENIINYQFKTETYNNNNRYEGQFRNGKREGKGIYYFNNGNRYEGYFKDDKREGKGIYYCDNNIYEEDFKNNKREGKGIFYYKNGDREMRNYLNDKRAGKHAKLHANGEVTSEIFLKEKKILLNLILKINNNLKLLFI